MWDTPDRSPLSRALLILPLTLLLTACPRPPVESGDPTEAWRQAQRRVASDPTDAEAHLEAARLAVFLRNDPVQAERLLTAAVRDSSQALPANVLRTYLSWRRRDYPAVLDRAQAALEADPDDPRAEMAAWFLEWVANDPRGFDGRVGPWLERLLAERGGSRGLRRVAGRILATVRKREKRGSAFDRVVREVAGGLTQVATACPFGLYPALDFHRPLAPERHDGALRELYEPEGPAPRRTVRTVSLDVRDRWLACPDWPSSGAVAFHETHVRVPEEEATLTTTGWWSSTPSTGGATTGASWCYGSWSGTGRRGRRWRGRCRCRRAPGS